VYDRLPPLGLKTHFPAVSCTFSDRLPTKVRPVMVVVACLSLASANPLVLLLSMTLIV
jgi:hypothetical protein